MDAAQQFAASLHISVPENFVISGASKVRTIEFIRPFEYRRFLFCLAWMDK